MFAVVEERKKLPESEKLQNRFVDFNNFVDHRVDLQRHHTFNQGTLHNVSKMIGSQRKESENVYTDGPSINASARGKSFHSNNIQARCEEVIAQGDVFKCSGLKDQFTATYRNGKFKMVYLGGEYNRKTCWKIENYQELLLEGKSVWILICDERLKRVAGDKKLSKLSDDKKRIRFGDLSSFDFIK